jgi:dolichyl-diphosphooligosaccharide--protein glycosyltransferase
VERQISSRAVAAIALVASVAIAFAVRVLPAFSVVFAHGIVNFQEPDAWFHVRTVHNLLAHFPHRSGFDPYVLFPGGQEVPTAPVWDYLLAWSAWILGWGAPSPELIDRVAAWIPAILGALFPIPAFFLARRLFGSAAAVFAALWMAAGFGTFLWITHLGLADHHVAEGLFAFLVLTWMCMAIDQRSARFAWLSGIALGLFLATRPAGIFVPATLACLVVLEPTASAMVLRAVLAGAVVFLPASESLWREYTWLSLAAAGGLAAAVLALDALARRQGWPPWVKRSIPFAAMALAAAAAMLAMPHLLGSLWYQIRRVAGAEEASRIVSTVQELQPVYRSGPGGIWSSIFHSVGISWIPALPVLVWLVLLWPARTALRLLVLWSVVMGLATIMQVRMAVYWLPVATVPAGAACAWLIHANRATRRRMVAAALGVAVLALNLPWAIELMRNDQGMSQDWLSAFTWLRENSPEPLDAGVWSGYYPHLKAGESHPSGAWGVAIWWDRGYALEELAHRIPMSNGTQSGADDMARFYTETIPEAAVGWLRRSGARYVVVDPQEPLFSGENHSRFPVQIRMLGRNQDSYVQYLAEQTSEGGFKTRPIYLPTYYQTMAARLYLSDGAAVDGTGPWVFETQPTSAPNGRTMELIVAAHRFNTEAEASAYLSRPHSARVTVGCLNPGKSCIALPAVKGIRRVFSSDPLPLSPKRAVRAVKIFEVMPEE